MDTILNTKQIAERLGIHINTIYGYLTSGKLEGYKLGDNSNSKRHWRIREKDLEAFIDGQGGNK